MFWNLHSVCNHVRLTQEKLSSQVFLSGNVGIVKVLSQNAASELCYLAGMSVDFVPSGTGGFRDRTEFNLGYEFFLLTIFHLELKLRKRSWLVIEFSLEDSCYEVNEDVEWLWYETNICVGAASILSFSFLNATNHDDSSNAALILAPPGPKRRLCSNHLYALLSTCLTYIHGQFHCGLRISVANT